MKVATDLLREKFGEIKLEVVKQDLVNREVRIVSGNKVCSYAIVKFNLNTAKKISRVHKKIVCGKSLAQTLRENNVRFKRKEICSFFYFAPDMVKNIFSLNENKVYVKKINILIQGKVYASIIELYSPLLNLCSLYENYPSSIQNSLLKLNLKFNCEGYAIKRVELRDILEYLDVSFEFLKKKIHVGIENKGTYFKEVFEIAKKVILDNNSTILSIQNSIGFCGYLSANLHPALHLNSFECIVREIHVREFFRRKGFGKILFDVLEKIAFFKGAKRVSLVTNLGNKMQKGFYDNIGYSRRCDFLVKYLKEDKN